MNNEAFRDAFNHLNVALFTEKTFLFGLTMNRKCCGLAVKSSVSDVPEGVNQVTPLLYCFLIRINTHGVMRLV